MKPRNLLIAAILLAALSGVVWWSKRHPEAAQSTPATPSNPKLVDIPEAQVQSINLKKKDGPLLTVERKGDKWAITQPQPYATDQDAVNSLASSLSPVSADNVVEDKATDLGKYGLTTPSLTVAVRQKNGKTSDLVFGDDVPAGSLVYARVGTEPKVYAVSSSVKTSFDKGVNDLRDKRLLTFNSNNLSRIELLSGKSDIEFGKSNANDWQIIKPQPYRADNFQVEELLRKLTDAKMDLSTSAGDAKKADTSFASGQPVASAKVSDAGGTQSLDVRKNKDDYYARSSSVKGVYKVSSDLGKELEKTLDDFRNKKIFDFGFSDPTKIEVTGTPGDKTYTRSGTDWKLNGQVMDSASVQSFIDKLRDLAATKFATSSFSSPVMTLAVTSNDGKRFEKVELAKTNDGYLARRQNEPALYQLDNKAVSDILEAGKAIKPATPSKK
ncbi:MAG: DUF4340 domain-containing protein [Acidobacteriaceae bacterium]|nr:DUF4340 domain-containing protein [Acidobacteriaceae bacterium]